jgi:hypothetical protein
MMQLGTFKARFLFSFAQASPISDRIVGAGYSDQLIGSSFSEIVFMEESGISMVRISRIGMMELLA